MYARVYHQNNESRDFYQFLKTMETYKNTLSEKDCLVLSTKGDFFKFLQLQPGWIRERRALIIFSEEFHALELQKPTWQRSEHLHVRPPV